MNFPLLGNNFDKTKEHKTNTNFYFKSFNSLPKRATCKVQPPEIL